MIRVNTNYTIKINGTLVAQAQLNGKTKKNTKTNKHPHKLCY